MTKHGRRVDFTCVAAAVFVLAVAASSSATTPEQGSLVRDAQDFLFSKPTPEMPYLVVDRDTPLYEKRDGLEIYVSHHASPRWDDLVFPILEIFEGGNSVISAAFSDSETIGGRAWLAIERLDPRSPHPQVIVTRYDGGGAQCCFQTSIFTADGDGWTRIDAPYQYSDLHYRITDIDDDGRLELVGLDSAFLAQGRAWLREQSVPVRAFALDGRQLSDVWALERGRHGGAERTE